MSEEKKAELVTVSDDKTLDIVDKLAGQFFKFQENTDDKKTERLRLELDLEKRVATQGFTLLIAIIIIFGGCFIAIMSWAIFHGDQSFMKEGLFFIGGLFSGMGLGWSAKSYVSKESSTE